MNTLIAVAYPDVDTAERVRRELIEASKQHMLSLQDAVVVEHGHDGKIKLHQAMHPGRKGAVGGAVWGGVIGLLFLAPLLGAAVGAAAGGGGGAIADVGVDDTFMKDLGARLKPGAAALIALGRTDARDEVIERVRKYGGHVIQTSLSREEEEHLRAALGEAVPTA